ncbi:MAG: hypothetical protein ACI9WU_002772 [Myxococcota bacterium]|jgi:hypothetical protein
MIQRLILVGLVGVVACATGCKKDQARKQVSFKSVYERLQSALAPADFEFPLRRLRELEDTASKDDVKAAARFELARGWLRLGVLSGVPQDSADARRVMAVTGMKEPEESIAKRFDTIGDVMLGDMDLGKWGKDGGSLTRAFVGDDSATISQIALGDGAFSSEAAAIIFTWMIKVGDGSDSKSVRQILSFACADEADLYKGSATDHAALGAACAKAPWASTPAPEKTPCGALTSVGANPAQVAVEGYFQKLLAAYGKGSASGPVPDVFLSRFPVEGGCAVAKQVVDLLATGGAKAPAAPSAPPSVAPAPAASDNGTATVPAGDNATR